LTKAKHGTGWTRGEHSTQQNVSSKEDNSASQGSSIGEIGKKKIA